MSFSSFSTFRLFPVVSIPVARDVCGVKGEAGTVDPLDTEPIERLALPGAR